MTIQHFSSAKVNLALHITGKRTDGFHELDSLVVFPNIGDKIEFSPASVTNLEVIGPFADNLTQSGNRNLILEAASLLTEKIGNRTNNVSISLEKNLPVAGGVGGGSSNAATTLTALNQLWKVGLTDRELSDIAGLLGSDVPVCLSSVPARIRGIGGDVTKISNFPSGSIVLANPTVALPTSEVFANFDGEFSQPLPKLPEPFDSFADLVSWLASTKNDLEKTARKLVPEITETLTALQKLDWCAFAGMSGSGATCFGLFEDIANAERAAQSLQHDHPEWWIRSGSF